MATKQQVADAARRLFATHGYVATTITAVAEAADIPAPTIYSAFGSKAKILKAIAWGATATLDIDRSHDQALAAPDPAQGLRLAAHIQRRQFELMYDVIAIYQEAARTDPDIAQDLQTIMENRERAFRRHLRAIADHLASGVTVDDGLAVYLALVVPEVYRTLVIERRWSIDRYEDWLADTLIHHLLDGTRTVKRGRGAGRGVREGRA